MSILSLPTSKDAVPVFFFPWHIGDINFTSSTVFVRLHDGMACAKSSSFRHLENIYLLSSCLYISPCVVWPTQQTYAEPLQSKPCLHRIAVLVTHNIWSLMLHSEKISPKDCFCISLIIHQFPLPILKMIGAWENIYLFIGFIFGLPHIQTLCRNSVALVCWGVGCLVILELLDWNSWCAVWPWKTTGEGKGLLWIGIAVIDFTFPIKFFYLVWFQYCIILLFHLSLPVMEGFHFTGRNWYVVLESIGWDYKIP